MIFDKIRLVGYSSVVELPLRGAQPTDPFILKDVDGLGPSEVVVNIKETLTRGGIMQSVRPRNKQLDMLIKLNPNYALNERPDMLRDQMYVFLSPVMGYPIRIELVLNGGVVAQIKGYLSRATPNPFSKDPELQVSMPCLQPYFEAPAVINHGPTEFPSSAYSYTINNVGTAPAPFAFSFTVHNSGSIFGLTFDSAPSNYFGLEIVHPFTTNNEFAVGGIPGAKFANYAVPGQPTVNVLGKLSARSNWPELTPGPNVLNFSHMGKINWFYYTPRYQGI